MGPIVLAGSLLFWTPRSSVGVQTDGLSDCCSFSGDWFEGSSSSTNGTEFLQMLEVSRRMWAVDAEIQTVGMLISGSNDGILEGPTWGAWWTQNSFGTTMSSLPFVGSVVNHAIQESQNWWFNNQADGVTSAYASGTQGYAPDGALCDNGSPTNCNYKQGDGNVPIHDWTLEEGMSACVMEAERLLIARNTSGIQDRLPHFVRASNLLESRRDPATGMETFLSGPSSNLLAPSFGAWKLPNGRAAWSYLTGLSITYTAALNRFIEISKIVNDTKLEQVFTVRRDLNLKGLHNYYEPNGSYFVRSVDPNGTLHGVVGAARHGYFEASPNHDAIAWRIVNDSQAHILYESIVAQGDKLFPNTFILPNTDARGGESKSGAGSIGYDDMSCGDGAQCGGIFQFGTWVNGGVWTTTEARWLLASARLNNMWPALASVKQMYNMYSKSWRMDNPLVDFGLAPYQADEDINLTIDNFGSPGAFIRGLFEYVYSAFTLTLLPHFPDDITQLNQKFGIRWGAYTLFISTKGIRSSGIANLTINGNTVAPSTFNTTAVVLNYGSLPPASEEAKLAIESELLSTSTRLDIHINFAEAGNITFAPALGPSDLIGARQVSGSWDCESIKNATSMPVTSVKALQSFLSKIETDVSAMATIPAELAVLALKYQAAFDDRCLMINNGTLPNLRSVNATRASLVQLLSTAASLYQNVGNVITHAGTRSTSPIIKKIVSVWQTIKT